MIRKRGTTKNPTRVLRKQRKIQIWWSAIPKQEFSPWVSLPQRISVLGEAVLFYSISHLDLCRLSSSVKKAAPLFPLLFPQQTFPSFSTLSFLFFFPLPASFCLLLFSPLVSLSSHITISSNYSSPLKINSLTWEQDKSIGPCSCKQYIFLSQTISIKFLTCFVTLYKYIPCTLTLKRKSRWGIKGKQYFVNPLVLIICYIWNSWWPNPANP